MAMPSFGKSVDRGMPSSRPIPPVRPAMPVLRPDPLAEAPRPATAPAQQPEDFDSLDDVNNLVKICNTILENSRVELSDELRENIDSLLEFLSRKMRQMKSTESGQQQEEADDGASLDECKRDDLSGRDVRRFVKICHTVLDNHFLEMQPQLARNVETLLGFLCNKMKDYPETEDNQQE